MRIFKVDKKTVWCIVLTQIVILLLFLWGIYESKPVKMEDCTSEKIVVEDKEYARKLFGEYNCYVSYLKSDYVFPNLGVLGDYTSKELYEIIQIGETMEILYTKRLGIWGCQNLILDAESETGEYLDFDLYNQQKGKAFTAMIVIFSIVELIFLSVVVCILVLNTRKRIFTKK